MSFHKDFEHEGERLRVVARPKGDGRYIVQVGDRQHEVEAERLPDGRVRFSLNGEVHQAATGRFGKVGVHLRLDGQTELVPFHVAGHHASGGGEASGVVEAPMTGTVLSIPVQPGQTVSVGDTVLVLSAMKMEHKLRAAIDGTVEVLVTEGETVDQGAVLLRIEPAEG